MKRLLLHTICLMSLLLTACSHIDEADRLIYVKPAAVSRHVLIEEFTGQRCINCPTAHEQTALLQQQYGDSAVIVVSLHGGPLSFASNGQLMGLRTEAGDAYYNHWQLDYLPVALIDRSEPLGLASWNARVHETLQQSAPVAITLHTHTDGTSLVLDATVQALDAALDGHLQLWVVEDHITAFQLMPDGSMVRDYDHRHVFRAAINGFWGDSVTLDEGDTWSVHYTMPLDAGWNASALSVVAFVYDHRGVCQVVQSKPNEQ